VKRLLVTGLNGFVGTAAREALDSGITGVPFTLVVPEAAIELLDPVSLTKAIAETHPELVLHLAAQSFVPTSIHDPRATYNINFFGTLNLLEALQVNKFTGRLLYVSSGEVYGIVRPDALPISETHPLQPRNPYSVSKAAAELLCYQWAQTHDFETVIARPFNHIGPGQAERFVVPDFARQVNEIKLGRREPVINVGSIDVTRDFIDVRDVVRAYFSLLESGERGEAYNVCSGAEQSVRSILERLIALAGVECRIVVDKTRVRPNEQKRMCGSYAKLNRQVGWRPTIDSDQSLRDVLSHWESRLKHV
jgi:GDP-4-dehydro-6-deoxy-D-mannose reductase